MFFAPYRLQIQVWFRSVYEFAELGRNRPEHLRNSVILRSMLLIQLLQQVFHHLDYHFQRLRVTPEYSLHEANSHF